MDIASYIDHTILKAEATPEQIITLCEEAIQYKFAAVCVNGIYVDLAAKTLGQAGPQVCTVVGFPLGASTTVSKVAETVDAVKAGATEIDMVIHVGGLKAGNYKAVQEDIAQVSRASHEGGAVCKVIIETALLNEEEKITACKLAKEAGADYVKTSTGFSTAGATPADVSLMRRTVGPDMGVKAAGGIRDYLMAQKMISAGATRIGASSGVKIVQEAQQAK